jgi:hypothetical protein
MKDNEIDFILDECYQFLDDYERDFLKNLKKLSTASKKQIDFYNRIRAKTSQSYSEMEGFDYANEFRYDQ